MQQKKKKEKNKENQPINNRGLKPAPALGAWGQASSPHSHHIDSFSHLANKHAAKRGAKTAGVTFTLVLIRL